MNTSISPNKNFHLFPNMSHQSLSAHFPDKWCLLEASDYYFPTWRLPDWSLISLSRLQIRPTFNPSPNLRNSYHTSVICMLPITAILTRKNLICQKYACMKLFSTYKNFSVLQFQPFDLFDVFLYFLTSLVSSSHSDSSMITSKNHHLCKILANAFKFYWSTALSNEIWMKPTFHGYRYLETFISIISFKNFGPAFPIFKSARDRSRNIFYFL